MSVHLLFVGIYEHVYIIYSVILVVMVFRFGSDFTKTHCDFRCMDNNNKDSCSYPNSSFISQLTP